MPYALANGLVSRATDHRRDVGIIAQQQLARACAHSLCEPHDETWPQVIDKLTRWVHRLQSGE